MPPKTKSHLPINGFTLSNGLQVIVQTDKTVPMVAVSITFKVGSQDESRGRSGFAHIFEHLMFQGTKNLAPNEISRLIESNGGIDNAYTMKTNTTYHEIVPKSALPLVLWAEADRMTGLDVNERALAVEKQVVLEEMRQSYLNKPYRRAMDQGMAEAAFSKWENHHTTIGEMKDLREATLEDVRAFYRAHYAPNNAVLALAGDVTLSEAKKLTEKYFGSIPAREIPQSHDLTEKPLKGKIFKKISDPLAKMPLTVIGWHAPARGGKDYWALSLLMEILGGGEESPLYAALVKNSKLALSASGFMPYWSKHYNGKGPDLFAFSISPKADAPVEKIVRQVDLILKRFADKGPSMEELERAKTQTELEWTDGLQFLMDRAQTLSSYAALIGNPKNLEKDLRDILSITPADVRKAVRRWVTPGRVILHVVPGKPVSAEAEEKSPPIPAETPRTPASVHPAPDSMDHSPIPALRRFSLKNGLNVVFVQDKRLPLLEMRLSIKGGKTDENPGEEGLSQACSELMLKGAAGKDDAAVARAFARLGFSINVRSNAEFLKVSASGLSRNSQPFFRQLGEVLTGADYPHKETLLWKDNAVEELESMRADPGFLSDERQRSELFSDHPYRKGTANEAEIAAVTSRRLAGFHQRRVIPRDAVMILVGNISSDAARDMLEKGFSGWTGSHPKAHVAPMPANKDARLSIVHRPGSTQASLSVSQIVPLTPDHPDFLSFLVMNHILGGTANSRLFENLRTDKGYTYGSYSSVDSYGQGLVWTAEAEVRNEVARPAVEEIFKEIRLMGETTVSRETLAKVKRYLGGLFLLKRAALDRTANYLSALEEAGRDPIMVMSSYLQRLEAVTPADIQSAARRHLDSRRMLTVVVGDRSALKSLKTIP